MKAKSTINKIIKGVGKSEFGEKVKKAGKFINNHILEDVPDKNKYDSLLYQVFPKRIKQYVGRSFCRRIVSFALFSFAVIFWTFIIILFEKL